MKYRRIGLFGGAFDPIHEGHIGMAISTIRQLYLDSVIWIPRSGMKHGRNITSAFHRLNMMNIALSCFNKDYRHVYKKELSVKESVPSIITIKHIISTNDSGISWYWMLGSDQFQAFDTWHSWRSILDIVTVAVYPRINTKPYMGSILDIWDNRLDPKSQIVEIKAKTCDVSSSEIRSGKKIDCLIAEVDFYIKKYNLYEIK